MPMPRSAGSSQVTFLSPIQICPASMSSRPAMAFSSVDLPQPEAPRRTMNSPASTSRSRSSQHLEVAEGDAELADRDARHRFNPSPRRRRCRARTACRRRNRS